MILTTHILAGTLVGAEVKNPYEIAGLAIVLHFLMDMLPHGDYLNKKSSLREFWKVAIDLALGFGLVAYIVLRHTGSAADPVYTRNIILGIFFSLLPDGTTLLYWKMGMKFLRPVKSFHEKLHHYPYSSPKRRFHLENNFWDVAISLIIFIFLLL
jgi:hypothetical protein